MTFAREKYIPMRESSPRVWVAALDCVLGSPRLTIALEDSTGYTIDDATWVVTVEDGFAIVHESRLGAPQKVIGIFLSGVVRDP